MTNYAEFLASKQQLAGNFGFNPIVMPDALKDFQKYLVEWALIKGRAAIFADCGLGKTFIQLAWADNVVRHTNKPVLILTPLAVSRQTIREAEKFGFDAERIQDGKVGNAKIVVTNYERLEHFNADDFAGCVCDESSILKNFDGTRKAQITEFMRMQRYRLLCTATAAPNDFIELGTSSEALGNLGHMDMLAKFFKHDGGTNTASGHLFYGLGQWRFRGHAERDFWRWVCSWARAVRKPSDIGFSNSGYELPDLEIMEHIVAARSWDPEMLFEIPAFSNLEQIQERKRTVQERCEKAAEVLSGVNSCAVAWCNLNTEGDLLERLIPGSVQIQGSDSDDKKEETFDAFAQGQIKHLVTKPKIAGFGLNWQHVANQSFFPSHSFEQFYQAIRRSWRFGQIQKVLVHIITTEGGILVTRNFKRKKQNAEVMFQNLITQMNNELHLQIKNTLTNQEEIPSWL